MANYTPGQVGTFNGKIGRVVMCKWRDMLVGKSSPTPSKKAPTQTQKTQQSKFGLVTAFLSSIGNILDFGFRTTKANNSAMNVAVSYHIANAVTGDYPDHEFDLSKLLLSKPTSKNRISMVDNAEGKVEAGHKFSLTWEPSDFPLELTKDADKAHLLFYSEEVGEFLYLAEIAARTVLTTSVTLPRSLTGTTVHAYLLFASVDKKLVSDTNYLGQYTVLA